MRALVHIDQRKPMILKGDSWGYLRAGGVSFYYRYTLPSAKRDTLPIGRYDPTGRHGLTLLEASDRAGELSRRYQAGERDLRAVLETEQRAAEQARADAKASDVAEQAAARATLGALLDAYVAQLRRDGKSSAREIERAVSLHVAKPWPLLWGKPADEVTGDDLLAIIAKVADAGTLRAAAKLRSYLRAAYAAAIRARQSARGLQALRDLLITSNPARDLVTIEGASNARARALSVAELCAYWRRIEALPDPDGALLRFHLLTGGQRVEQLARLTTADVDDDTGTFTLRDNKGRRRKPRLHVVPMIPAAKAAMQAMGGELGPYAFTVSQGLEPAAYHVLQHRVRAIGEAMKEAGELEKGPFTVGDLRRTVETRLAAAGVSLEIRAQLQSHGLGGVQARHYDRHGYHLEKLGALETLHRITTGSSARVTPIKRTRATLASP